MMKTLSLALGVILLAGNEASSQPTDQQLRSDWANFARYHDANSKLPPPAANENRVVFMGNSITEGWEKYFPTMFAGKPYIGRGISGRSMKSISPTAAMSNTIHPS